MIQNPLLNSWHSELGARMQRVGRQFVLFMICLVYSGYVFVCDAQPIVEARLFTARGLEGINVITHAGDERIFAGTRRGVIWQIEANGRIRNEPFLDISNKVGSRSAGQGLLGLAFHPRFAENGFFFVYYTGASGASILERFRVDSEVPEMGDAQSGEILLIFNQPYDEHNGSQIQFGPDGYLYIATGDGGGRGDPLNLSQSTQSFMGKILRIDINSQSGYTIPRDNPFLNDASTLDEVWAMGIRNPSGLFIDFEESEIWVADRGQDYMEEINQLDIRMGGLNLGWPCYEGTRPAFIENCPGSEQFTFPVAEYRHRAEGQHVIGGAVYRGRRNPYMYGSYFFADKISGNFYEFTPTSDSYVFRNLGDLDVPAPGAMGVNSEGEILVASHEDGRIYILADFCQDFQPRLFLVEDKALLVRLEGNYWDGNFEIDWYMDDKIIADGKDSILYVDRSENYRVQLIHEAGCIMNSEVLQVQLMMPEINWSELVTMWPNPFTTSFTLQSRAEFEMDAIIIDSDGRKVDAQVIAPSVRFSWNVQLPKGFYTLQLVAPNGAQHTLQIIRK